MPEIRARPIRIVFFNIFCIKSLILFCYRHVQLNNIVKISHELDDSAFLWFDGLHNFTQLQLDVQKITRPLFACD